MGDVFVGRKDRVIHGSGRTSAGRSRGYWAFWDRRRVLVELGLGVACGCAILLFLGDEIWHMLMRIGLCMLTVGLLAEPFFWGMIVGFTRASNWWNQWQGEAVAFPCPVCGYDIRATPHGCPECGAKLRWGILSEERRR